jgi:hypothetical protein|tara:strand:- start:2383 stop:2931 length:549 start_codon:yes stop_codon:yes gene_type:complete
MGQFFNQPDFITKAKAIVASDVLTTANYLDGATLWVGGIPAGGVGDVKVIMAGTLGGKILTLEIQSSGIGYNVDGVVRGLDNTIPSNSAGGEVIVSSVGSGGEVTGLTVNTAGLNYSVGDVLYVQGGGAYAAIVMVASVDDAVDPSQFVSFKGLTYGQYLPVAVDYVMIAPSPAATDLVACH